MPGKRTVPAHRSGRQRVLEARVCACVGEESGDWARARHRTPCPPAGSLFSVCVSEVQRNGGLACLFPRGRGRGPPRRPGQANLD